MERDWPAYVSVLAVLLPAWWGLQVATARGETPMTNQTAPAAVDASVTFHVALNGDDAWSGRLAAPAADRADGPFATIARARQAVRALKVNGELPAAVRVELHGGTHFLAEPLRFTPDDSGSPPRMGDWQNQLGGERSVTYAAAAGETPVVSGGRRITGWTRGEVAGREAWTVTLPKVSSGEWYFTQLWVNGRRATRPRLPRVGPGKFGRNEHFRIAEILGEIHFEGDVHKCLFTGQDEFRYADNDLAAFHNVTDVEFVALHFWIESRIRFASIDPATKTAKLQWKSRMRLTDDFNKLGAPYYIENVREALDTPGQWYLDGKSGVLTYLPLPGETIDAAEIVAPVLRQLVLVEGEPAHADKPARFVERLRFDGVTFSHSEWTPGEEAKTATPQAACHVPGAFVFSRARECSLRNGGVTHVGSYGVETRDACSDIDIADNTISDLGGGGVKVWHTPPPAAKGTPGGGPDMQLAESCRRITLSDNVIADGGHRYHQAVGVLIGKCSGNKVLHNHIHDFDYTGISVGWTWGYAESGAYGNIIERNLVHDIGRGMLSDMGGIYTLGVSPGTRIRFNVFRDVESRGYGGWAIYTDEGSTDILIESNLAYRTKSQAFHQHYGRDNIVRNNIFGLSREALIARSRLEPHSSFAFTRNIVLLDNDGKVLAGNWKDTHATVDGNLYFHLAGTRQKLDFAGGDFAAWQGRGMDTHSLVADPMMKDPAAGDFRMDPRSPAIEKLGFVPWDFENVGPRKKSARP